MMKIIFALLILTSCGPSVPYETCTAGGTERCNEQVAEYCVDGYWQPELDCSSIYDPDGNKLEKKCTMSGDAALCK